MMNKEDQDAINKHLGESQSVAAVWHFYEQMLLREAGAVQRKETRQAFYAGVDWLLQRLLLAVDDEAAAEQLLGRISRELEEFRQQIQKEAI